MTTGKSQERIFFYTSKYMQTFILFLGVTYSVVEEYVNTRSYPVILGFLNFGLISFWATTLILGVSSTGLPCHHFQQKHAQCHVVFVFLLLLGKIRSKI